MVVRDTCMYGSVVKEGSSTTEFMKDGGVIDLVVGEGLAVILSARDVSTEGTGPRVRSVKPSLDAT